MGKLILTAVAAITMFSVNAQASKTCKVATNDIGTIVGRGPTSEQAFEDAATKCFDRLEKLHQLKKGAGPDEETGLVMIDVCANVRCG